MHLGIIECISILSLNLANVQHPLFLLCVCFEIIPNNDFEVIILFYPLSFDKLPIFIC